MAGPIISQVDLKQRGPVAWTLISLLVPFGMLVWLHKSQRQINFLNQEAGRPQRLISPWWVTGPTLLTIGLLAILFSLTWSNSSDAALAQADTTVPVAESVIDPPPVLPDEDFDPFGPDDSIIPYDPVVSDPVGFGSDLSNQGEDPGDANAALALGALLIILALFLVAIGVLIVYIIYLVKHVDGVVALAGTNDDKTVLLVMAILGVLVFGPLIAFVVYKSQEIINQAIADRADPAPAGPQPV